MLFRGQAKSSNSMKDLIAHDCKDEVSNIVEDTFSTGKATRRSPMCMKSIGSFENYLEAYAVVCRMFYDSCMQVMWNAVFYDTIADYSSAWRKRKRWYNPNFAFETGILSKQHAEPVERIPDEVVGFMPCLFLLSSSMSIVLFPYGLQLDLYQESSASEVDFPPGFGVAQKALELSSQLPMGCFSPLEGRCLHENVLIPGNIEDETLETVLNDLHLSTNASFVQYFSKIVDKEVKRMIVAKANVRCGQVMLDIILCCIILLSSSYLLAPSFRKKTKKKIKP